VFAAILAALQAFVEASKDFKLLVATYQKYQDAEWKQKLADVSSVLSGPTTPEQKANAARDLATLIAKLG
jgi:hypothetical protein